VQSPRECRGGLGGLFLGRLDQGLVGNAESTHVDRAKGKAPLVPKVGKYCNIVDILVRAVALLSATTGENVAKSLDIEATKSKTLTNQHKPLCSLPESARGVFFCWRLLGLIPGGAPFSQLNKGVKDAMVESTGFSIRQFMTKTCKKAILQTTTIYTR